MFFTLVLAFLFSEFLFAPSVLLAQLPQKNPQQFARTQRAKLMFYNVENLFDAEHDKDKDDWEFLPKTYPNKSKMCKKTSSKRFLERCLEADWADSKVALKIGQIAKVVNDARKPDIIGFAEVENKKVLTRLAKKIGYRGIVVADGNDRRGIDVGLLYRHSSWLKYVRHTQHMIRSTRDVSASDASANDASDNARLRTSHLRPMLEVEFRARGQRLHVFVTHWASPRSPTEYRLASSRTLIALVNERMRQDRRAAVVAMGDFNVVDRDYPHPFREGFFAKTLFDVESSYRRSDRVPWEQKLRLPFGTSFYPPRMSWDSLDRLFVNQQLLDGRGIELDIPSFSIFSLPYMANTFTYKREGEHHQGSVIQNVPKRYNWSATNADDAGFSDHYPVVVDLYM